MSREGGWFQAWYYMPLIPSLRNQRQEDLCEFGATWEYTANSRTVKITQRPCQKERGGEEIRGKGEVKREEGKDSKSDDQMSHEL